MSDAVAREAPGRLRAHPLLPALVLTPAGFLTQLDVTAVVVALPSIGRELGFGVAGFARVMDAYSLAFTALLLAAGALADRYGRRRALLAGNALFALASLACGLAWGGPSLWLARAVQGAGAAFLVTGTIALIAGAYPRPAERARAFAAAGVVSGAAMALGPTLGGLVAEAVGWRWIFLANLPVCALTAWIVPRLIAETRADDVRPLDLAGVALLTIALGLAIETLLQGARFPGGAAVGALAGAAFAAAFVLQQRRRARPVLDPALFARAPMIGLSLVLLALSVGYWAALVYLPLFLQVGFALTPDAAGLALLAATLPMLALPPLAGRLAPRWGWRRLFATSLAVVAAGDLVLLAAFAGADPALRPAALVLGLVTIGVGAALAQAQLSGAMVTLAPPAQAGMASAVTMVMRQGGFALGIAALGAALGAGGDATRFPVVLALAAGASLAGMLGALALLPARPRTGVGVVEPGLPIGQPGNNQIIQLK